jgi:hypothetical protein
MKVPTVRDTVHCERCGHDWPESGFDPDAYKDIVVIPGDEVPIGVCPDPDCGAVCYPPYGYVQHIRDTLEESRHELAAVKADLTKLAEWVQSNVCRYQEAAAAAWMQFARKVQNIAGGDDV